MSLNNSKTLNRSSRKTPRKSSLSSDIESWMSQSYHKILCEQAKKLKVKLLHNNCNSSETRKWQCSFHSGDAEIVKFDRRNTSNSQVLKKLQAITDYVDFEMGNASERLEIKQQVIFIMWIPSLHQVIGYLEAEPISECYKILSYFEGVITLHPTAISKSAIGISKLWTFRKYRRMGVATTLLDICRENFLEGQVIVSHTDLAFNALSDDLIPFLVQYLRDTVKDTLIYLPEINSSKMAFTI